MVEDALVDLAPIGHAALHLNAKPNFGVLDALQNCHRLDGGLLDGFVTRCDCGIHLLAAPQVPTSLKPSEDEVGRVLDIMVNHYRYVVVDVSSRLDPLVRMVCTFADTILFNGKVVVYDAPPAQALAVRDGRIAAIGSNEMRSVA